MYIYANFIKKKWLLKLKKFFLSGRFGVREYNWARLYIFEKIRLVIAVPFWGH